MSTDIAICARNLSKCYQIYKRPMDRLKQSFWRGKKKFYQEFWALKEASFEIAKGETVGIIGQNGSGKSTILQLICGTLSPTMGDLEVEGRVAALLELGAGFNPEFTGRENVCLNAAIMGLTQAELDARYQDIVDFADIGRFVERPVKTYSSGMYVRLAFATAVNVSADILVVDEALSVGDARFRQKCMEKIRGFCRSGTVVFVSHDMAAVTELCARVIWVESGKIKMDGVTKFVVEEYLQFMYEGDNKPCKSNMEDLAKNAGGSSGMRGFLPIDKNIRGFGDCRVTIEAVRLVSQNSLNGVVYAGEECEIGVILHAHEDIARPIVGFIVKDRLGREIIGDNTWLIKEDLPSLSSGRKYGITFKIAAWPNLREEDYALTIAVADGLLEDHVQCHFLHDSIIFRSIPVRRPEGIFSIPDTAVNFFRVGD